MLGTIEIFISMVEFLSFINSVVIQQLQLQFIRSFLKIACLLLYFILKF